MRHELPVRAAPRGTCATDKASRARGAGRGERGCTHAHAPASLPSAHTASASARDGATHQTQHARACVSIMYASLCAGDAGLGSSSRSCACACVCVCMSWYACVACGPSVPRVTCGVSRFWACPCHASSVRACVHTSSRQRERRRALHVSTAGSTHTPCAHVPGCPSGSL